VLAVEVQRVDVAVGRMTSRAAAVVGVGQTPLSRKPVETAESLVLAACQSAVDDAGIDVALVDGFNIQTHHPPYPDTAAITGRLGLPELRWKPEGGFGVAALVAAVAAVERGDCNATLVCKVMDTAAPVNTPPIDPQTGGVRGPLQFEVPYGLGYTMQRQAMAMRRWMYRYDVSPEQIGWLSVTHREHALLNPAAIMRRPLTLDEYLASRWIAEPLRLLDCDYPVNGAFAYLVATTEIARNLRWPAIQLLGSAEGNAETVPHKHAEEYDEIGPQARKLYTDTSLSPQDVDVWMLYDGFSTFPMEWMQYLGLVPPYEVGKYVEGGERIRYTAEHPLNTHGGQLSEGRMHGTGYVIEAVQQLRGNAQGRQAARAGTAFVSTGVPYSGAVAILGKG
jgi:acetyl-CoA acetyltransferase